MRWRPKRWENPFSLKRGEMGITDPMPLRVLLKDAFEAGADAMLEGLFGLAMESPTGTFTIDSRVYQNYKEGN